MIENGKNQNYQKKIKTKKEIFNNLKIKDVLKKFYQIQMFVAKNGFGNNMITP